MSKSEIFKYQRSQFPRTDRCLIYNRKRSVMGEFDTTEVLDTLFDLHGEKFYALGVYNDNTQQVELHQLTTQQTW